MKNIAHQVIIILACACFLVIVLFAAKTRETKLHHYHRMAVVSIDDFLAAAERNDTAACRRFKPFAISYLDSFAQENNRIDSMNYIIHFKAK